MFDTIKVAKKIREARIARNMTQMNLADAMGVSYQAVSNWERGNSMPDISKLEDLCRELGISVTELLGMEAKETAVVEKYLAEEEKTIPVEALPEIAPMLPPAEVKAQAKNQKLNVAALVGIAPYLDEDFLGELTKDMEVESLLVLQSLAPYLDEDVLDELVRRAPKDDFDGIAAMAPFLSEETLDYLVKRCEQKPEDAAFVQELACFLSEETLEWLVKHWGGGFDRNMIEMLAPFLEEESMDALADIQIASGNVSALAGLYPFMERETVRKVARALMEEGNLEALKEAAMFM